MLDVSQLLRVAREPERADEVRAASPNRFSDARAGQVPVVVWNVNRHCNMTCPHCYAAATDKPSPADLNTAEAKRLLQELANVGVKVLIFSGGEPLLREDLFELITCARDVGLSPQLSSNGVLIDECTALALKDAGIRYVGVSIDGRQSFNDRYRGMIGGFARASQGLRNAKNVGLKTGLRMTLTRLNLDQLDEMIDVAIGLKVNRFYLSHLLYSGRAVKLGDSDLSPEECRSTLEMVFARAEELLDSGAETTIVTGGNDSDGPLLLRWIALRYGNKAADRAHQLLLHRGGNSAGEKILSIDHRGRVHPDQFWQGMTLGNVRNDAFTKILANDFRSELRARSSKITGRCSECKYLSICRGSHRERALARYGDPWASDPACVMTDEEIGYLPETDSNSQTLVNGEFKEIL